MLFAMFYLNWIGIFGSLIAAALLIAGLTFGFRLMKVSYAPAWAVACVAMLGAFFAGTGGAEVVLLLLLFGVPLLGASAYLIAKLTSTKQVGVAAALGVFVCGFLFLLRSGTHFELDNREHAHTTQQTHGTLMNDQAARVRALREDIDRQQRNLFDSQVSKSLSNDNSAAGSSPKDDLAEALKSHSGVAWYPEVEERFRADIHPSMRAAGRALGRNLLPLIGDVTFEEVDPPFINIVQIHGSNFRKDAVKALDGLTEVMQNRFPNSKFFLGQGIPPNGVPAFDQNSIAIRLLGAEIESTNKPRQGEKFDLTAELSGHGDNGAGQKVTASVTVVDKLWADDLGQYMASNPSVGSFVAGRSGRLATNHSEARNAAIDDAVSMLTPIAIGVLKSQDQLLIRQPPENKIAERLKRELLAGQLIVDSFSQQLDHSVGSVWRAAVLVEVDYPWLERVFSTYLRQRQKEQRDRLSLGAALALLAAGIVVLHAGLNWITKGYHQKSVSMLSGVLAVVGVLMVLLIAIKFFEASQVEAVSPQPPRPSNLTGKLTL